VGRGIRRRLSSCLRYNETKIDIYMQARQLIQTLQLLSTFDLSFLTVITLGPLP
jgi:hypothetical protein